MNPATGPKSTSFQLAAAGFLAGLAEVTTSYFHNTGGVATNVHVISGSVVALGALVGKFVHDGSYNKASFAALGTTAAADFPVVKANAAKVLGVIETDIPGVKGAVTAVENRVKDLEAKVPDLAGIEAIVRTVVGEAFAKVATPTPAAPVA